MKYIIVLLLLNNANSILQAQSIFFKPGESGPGIQLLIGTAEGSTLFGGDLNFTAKGRFTVGVSFANSSNDDETNSLGIAPHIDYLVIKQGHGNMPISVNMGVGYQFTTITHDVYKGSIKAGTFLFNLGLFKELFISEKSSLIPSAGVIFTSTSIEIGYRTVSEEIFAGNIGISYTYKKFHLTPSVSFSENSTSLSFCIGFVFPK